MSDHVPYSELLKDPRWQKKRLEILQRDNFACANCGDTKSTLHVHHLMYERGKAPWEYEDDELSSLCENCHSCEHSCHSDYIDALVSAAHSRWLSENFFSIALGLRFMPWRLQGRPQRVVAEALRISMMDPRQMKRIIAHYDKNMAARRKQADIQTKKQGAA